MNSGPRELTDTELSADDLPVPENMRLQEEIWRFERIGWIALFLIIAAAVAGLLGGGPASSSAINVGHYAVNYDRFLHNDTSAQIRITMSPAATPSRLVTIAWRNSDHVQLDGISPEPSRTISRPHASTFVFSNTESHIVVSFTPLRAGNLVSDIRVDGRSPVTVSQFVYP